MGKGGDTFYEGLQPQLDEWGFQADEFMKFADRLQRQQRAQGKDGDGGNGTNRYLTKIRGIYQHILWLNKDVKCVF